MKILLINPPSLNEILSCNPRIISKERGHNPPLGILYLAGYLEKNSSHQVMVLDAQAEELNYVDLENRIRKSAADIVGITAMTMTMIDVLKVVEIVKRQNPQSKVVLGGPHVSIYPQETIDLPGVDYLVLGEGEVIFSQLILNISNIENLKKIKGLVFKEGGMTVNTGQPDFINDLDELPFPARHLAPYKKYSSLLAVKSPITTMFTSRGCPYRCTFCYRPNMGKMFRSVSARRVVDEMQLCIDMGIKEIFIYDDTFSVNKKRVVEICREIQKRDLRIPWDIRTRIDNIDRQILMELRSANCKRIHYGIEAGTAKILKVLNKDIDLNMAAEVFKMTKDLGISTFAYFMIGAPSETREDIEATIDFAKKLKTDYMQVTIFTPFPGTEIYKQGLERGVFEYDYWKAFAQNPVSTFKTKYWEENLSENELQELIVRVYREFYTRPSYILNSMLKIRSFEEFKRKLKAGMQVIRMEANV